MSHALIIEKDEAPDYQPWLVWGCAATFFFFQFVVRVSPSVFLDDLLKDLHVSASAAGALSGWYYFGYSNVQLFVGLILDRVGVRYPLTVAAILILIGCLIFSYSDNLTYLAFARFMMGVGSALGFLSCVKTASMWFVSERLGILIGLSILIGMSGATTGGYPMAYLVEHYGWRESMFILSVIAGMLALTSYTLVKDRSQPVTDHNEEELSITESLKVLLGNPQTYLYALYGALMYMPLSGFADLWGIKYMMMYYDTTRLQASGAVSMIFLGIGASGPLLALVADRWRSYKKLMILGSSLSLLLFMALIYIPLPSFTLTYFVFFTIGFALGAQFFGFACICEINPRQVSATASGLQNMLCMYGGGTSVYIIGYILDYVSDGVLDGHIASYTIQDFQLALITIPASITLAIIVMLFIREAYPQGEKA